MSATSYEVTLAPETLSAFQTYVANAENGMHQAWRAENPLWSARSLERTRRIRSGEAVVEMWSGSRPASVPHGLVHDLVGAVFVPGVTAKQTLALLQDYNNHQNIYKPEVVLSKLLKREKEHFKIYMRLLKKKVITVVLDTEHDVQYTALDEKCWTCCSYTTRIAEVQDPGLPSETVLPADSGHGFMWRLNSYWTLKEDETGTTVECRAISLTRDIPFALRLIIQPIVRNLPHDSLESTLVATRDAMRAKMSEASTR